MKYKKQYKNDQETIKSFDNYKGNVRKNLIDMIEFEYLSNNLIKNFNEKWNEPLL